MERSYDITSYIHTVMDNSDFFKEYYFHSIIDLNLVKLDQILEKGILSKKLIEKYNLLSFYVHSAYSGQCCNGNDYISLVDYNKLYHHDEINKFGPSFNLLFEAFSRHTLTSLSLVVDKKIQTFCESVCTDIFDDEVFAFEKIDLDNIKGIILPEHLSNKNLGDIPFLPGDVYCYKSNSVSHLIDCLENYFSKKIDRLELLSKTEELWDIYYKEMECPSICGAIKIQKARYGVDMKDILSLMIKQLWTDRTGIIEPTYMDIIKYINKNNLPIYEIGRQKIIKR